MNNREIFTQAVNDLMKAREEYYDNIVFDRKINRLADELVKANNNLNQELKSDAYTRDEEKLLCASQWPSSRNFVEEILKKTLRK